MCRARVKNQYKILKNSKEDRGQTNGLPIVQGFLRQALGESAVGRGEETIGKKENTQEN